MESPHDWPLIIWLFLAEAVGYMWLLWISRDHRVPGIAAFRGVVCGATMFLLAESVIMVTGDTTVQFLLSCLSFMSAGLIAPCIVLLFAARTGWSWWTRPPVRQALLATGLLLGGLRTLDPWTGWVSRQAEETTTQHFGFHIIIYQPNWGYVAMLGLCAAAALFCVWATLRAWPESSRLQRRQLAPMAVACLPPLLSEVLFNLDPVLLRYVDPTPGVLGFTVAMMGWAVLRSGFVEVLPIARAFLFENLNQPIVATDERRLVIDYNRAAGHSLGLRDDPVLGQPLDEALAAWPALVEFCQRETGGRFEYRSGAAAEQRFWDATWHPLEASGPGQRPGYLLMLTDITTQKHHEQALAEALTARTLEWERATKEAMSAAEEEQRRIGRVLHDSLCQDLVGFVRTTESILASGKADQTKRLTILLARLQQASRRARNVAHILEGPDFSWTSLDEALAAQLAQMETQLDLSCDLTISPYFPALPPDPAHSFLSIVREAVVNAARHARARRIWVDLTCAVGAAVAVATISNDGTPPPPVPVEGLGLRQMRMRAALLGAQLTLERGPSGQGARVRLQFPVPAAAEPPLPTS